MSTISSPTCELVEIASGLVPPANNGYVITRCTSDGMIAEGTTNSWILESSALYLTQYSAPEVTSTVATLPTNVNGAQSSWPAGVYQPTVPAVPNATGVPCTVNEPLPAVTVSVTSELPPTTTSPPTFSARYCRLNKASVILASRMESWKYLPNSGLDSPPLISSAVTEIEIPDSWSVLEVKILVGCVLDCVKASIVPTPARI